MIPNNVMNFLQRLNPNIAVFQNMQSPDDVAQYLLNNGKVSQAQVNQAKQMWENPQMKQQIQNNPMFRQVFNNQN